MIRQIVADGIAGSPDDRGMARGDAGFFCQFAQGRRFQLLARIDAALRHLPEHLTARFRFARIDAAADEHLAVAH